MISRLTPRRALPLVGAALLGLASACAGPQKPVVQSPSAPPPAALAVPAAPPLPPPQESLRELIPERAVLAGVVRKHALAPLRELFTQDPTLQQELSAYLRQSMGVDLTELSGLVFFSTSLSEPPRGAVILRLQGAETARLPLLSGSGSPEPLPPHLGVPLLRLDGETVAAALPGALLLGSADAVREAIAVHKRLAGALSPASPLGGLLSGDPRVTDIEVAVAARGVGDAAVQAGLARFGASGVVLTYENVGSGRLTLTVHGERDKLTLAKGLLMTVVESTLREMEGKKEVAKQGSDIARAAGMIVGFHYGRRLIQELEPRIEGDRLVMQYNLPAALRGGFLPYLGVLSAVAIPSFMKYIERSKALSVPIPQKRGL